VRGSYDYACTSSDGLLIIDVANPASPALVARGGPGSALDIEFVGNLAFVAASSQGLMIYDATNPTNLTFVGGLANLASARNVYVRSNLVYLLHRRSGLEILDVSNPAAPVHHAFYDTGDYGSGLSIVGTNAYVADLFFGVEEIDITFPTALRRVRTYYPPGGAVYLKSAGPFFYIVDGSSGLQIYSFGPHPRPAVSIQTSEDAATISWSPWLPGQVLESTDALSPTNWTRSPSGGANPITVPTSDRHRLFRILAR
jgi:hypothetical protein